MITTQQVLGALSRHPILTAVFTFCVIGGIYMTIAWAPGDWGLARRIFAGLFAGTGVGFLVTAPNLYEEVSEEALKGHEHEVRSL